MKNRVLFQVGFWTCLFQIFVDFGNARTMKIMLSPRRQCYFHNFDFLGSGEFWWWFLVIFRSFLLTNLKQYRRKTFRNLDAFFLWFLLIFGPLFGPFYRFLTPKWGPKISKNHKKKASKFRNVFRRYCLRFVSKNDLKITKNHHQNSPEPKKSKLWK
jgi:hypothetical protein